MRKYTVKDLAKILRVDYEDFLKMYRKQLLRMYTAEENLGARPEDDLLTIQCISHIALCILILSLKLIPVISVHMLLPLLDDIVKKHNDKYRSFFDIPQEDGLNYWMSISKKHEMAAVWEDTKDPEGTAIRLSLDSPKNATADDVISDETGAMFSVTKFKRELNIFAIE